MTPAARYAAAIEVLDGFLTGEPAEKLLSNWARRNRYAGSKDRAAVRDIVFDSLRNLNSFAILSGVGQGRGIALGHCIAAGIAPDEIFNGAGYGPAPLDESERNAIAGAEKAQSEEFDLPEWLVEVFKSDLGEEAQASAAALRERAPVDLRVNIAKTTPEAAARALAAESILTEPVTGVPTALRVIENARRVAGSKPYLSGLVELQDAASQALVQMLELRGGQRVLDYCAGGGGKTLAMAAQEPRTRLCAWDISQARLAPLAERAKRAGAKVKLLAAKPVKAEFDLVLVDAPCSGSGAWRRNPEGKWRLQPEGLASLQKTQAQVLSEASALVVPGGTLIYATCSLLKRENIEVVNGFLSSHSEYSLQNSRSFLLDRPGDGFFCAILQKQL
ncbi:RsmB/NOP family class I SAM-dependent RNA methyltransferase [Neptunicoccus cionae]|uniref:RsmB/NOP family class I SAM-dependent RNA methyltransferase n=1 Tax=Neptunicoccus cionae TaxID=2035344 RepID=UPI000C76D590|nr:RsmB/NOP family class I SAM-dependent RNA methyltransferase [Amylibacter cionae]PLS20522.1 SAM-dependent methyltransferase [Amylibacter cionae]